MMDIFEMWVYYGMFHTSRIDKLFNNTVLQRKMSGHFYNWQDETSIWGKINKC